jgi:hypothetical protein
VWDRFQNRSKLQRKALASLVSVLLILLVASIIYRTRATQENIQRAPHTTLSPDVESVMRDFRYQDNSGSVNVEITGKEAALRGRKIMVFRSNLAKTTYFKDVSGSIISKKRTITFTAESGEWETTKNSPFILDRNIHLKINGTTIYDVKSVSIYFDNQTLETHGSTKTIYAF